MSLRASLERLREHGVGQGEERGHRGAAGHLFVDGGRRVDGEVAWRGVVWRDVVSVTETVITLDLILVMWPVNDKQPVK